MERTILVKSVKGKEQYSTKGKRSRGRPPIYDSKKFPHMAYVACAELGAKNTDLAKLFGVNADTIRRWCGEKSEFSVAVKDGRDMWDSMNAEKAMKRLVTGYEYEEVSITQKLSGTIVTKTKKHVAPNITAIMFWLQNREPHRWKNVRKVEASITTRGEITHDHRYSGEVKFHLDLSKLEKEEVENLRSIIDRATANAGRS